MEILGTKEKKNIKIANKGGSPYPFRYERKHMGNIQMRSIVCKNIYWKFSLKSHSSMVVIKFTNINFKLGHPLLLTGSDIHYIHCKAFKDKNPTQNCQNQSIKDT
jgi:hypothetical protein